MNSKHMRGEEIESCTVLEDGKTTDLFLANFRELTEIVRISVMNKFRVNILILE